jgi:alpha-tubulin suppressor-like RCC1 family protein
MRSLVLLAIAASAFACHDWSELSTAYEGSGVCVAYVVGGDNHTCGRYTDGALYCWGDNRFGQLGTGDTLHRASPVRVDFGGLEVVKIFLPAGDGDITADFASFSCAVTSDNDLWCWGDNRYGQLATGDVEPRFSPTRVAAFDKSIVKATNGAGYTCATTTAGEVFCWGRGGQGQLGTSTAAIQRDPGKADLPISANIDRIASGAAHTCARSTDATLWCWGSNEFGQLGFDADSHRTRPTKVDALPGPVGRVAGGASHTCAFIGDGEPWCWGDNRFGQLGTGDTRSRRTPERVDASELGLVTQVYGGGRHSCALSVNGSLWCWGANQDGQLGTGDNEPRLRPVQVAPDLFGTNVAAAYAGGAHTCAVLTDGSVWCWGSNRYGQLGVAGLTASPSAVRVLPVCMK